MVLSPQLLAALERTARPFGEAAPLPREALVGDASFALDLRLFARSWTQVAHETELRAPGQWRSAHLSGERLLLVRGADLTLRAFLDRCVHRGVPLTEGDEGTLPDLTLTCPYHGLRYDLAGRADLRSAPSLGYAAGARLPEVRLARFLGFVFVCLSPSTPPLEAWMGEVPPWLLRASTFALRLARRQSHDVAASWKLCAENFQESHHFPTVHPTLESLTPWQRSASLSFSGRWLGGTMEIRPGRGTVSDDGLLHDRPLVAHPDDARTVHDALLFPGWMTSLQPDYLLSYRLVPRAPDRTTIVSEIFFHEAAPAPGREAVFSFWDRTNAEDRAICERQQRGVATPSFEPGPYARTEDGLHAFDRQLAEAYLALCRDTPPPAPHSPPPEEPSP